MKLGLARLVGAEQAQATEATPKDRRVARVRLVRVRVRGWVVRVRVRVGFF